MAFFGEAGCRPARPEVGAVPRIRVRAKMLGFG